MGTPAACKRSCKLCRILFRISDTVSCTMPAVRSYKRIDLPPLAAQQSQALMRFCSQLPASFTKKSKTRCELKSCTTTSLLIFRMVSNEVAFFNATQSVAICSNGNSFSVNLLITCCCFPGRIRRYSRGWRRNEIAKSALFKGTLISDKSGKIDS